MRLLLVGILLLTLGVAGVATYLIRTYKNPEAIEELGKVKDAPSFKVLLANKNLPVGTVVTEGDVDWHVWVEEALNKQVFVWVDKQDQEAKRKKDIVGGIVRRAISAGEPVLESKLFKRDAPGFLAGMLGKGMRAVSVAVSAVTGASGFIFPADSIDVVLTHDKIKEVLKKRAPKTGKAPLIALSSASETILRNIRVIATGQQVTGFDKDSKAVVVPTVTLELTPKQAEILTTARGMGKLSLVLRSLEGNTDEPGPLTFTTDVEVSPLLSNIDAILQRLAPPKPAPKPAPVVAAVAPEPKKESPVEKEPVKIVVEDISQKVEKKTVVKVEEKKEKKKMKKKVIKVYRGGSAKTQEIEVK